MPGINGRLVRDNTMQRPRLDLPVHTHPFERKTRNSRKKTAHVLAPPRGVVVSAHQLAAAIAAAVVSAAGVAAKPANNNKQQRTTRNRGI